MTALLSTATIPQDPTLICSSGIFWYFCPEKSSLSHE